MKIQMTILFLLVLPLVGFGENDGIHVYDAVPGLAASEHYSFRVRTVGSTNWLEPFAFMTYCQKGGSTNHYYEHMEDWSNTYINFEMSNAVPVEIEISKVGGAPITNAVPHPAHQVDSCEVVGGKAYVVIDDPALFTVDIDGQMDDQDTARLNPTGWQQTDLYNGPPIHTLTIFANPFLQDKPSTNDNKVVLVEPGTAPDIKGNWDTLYFLPGVHEIGRAFPVEANKNYYIPGDAIVHGTFCNTNWSNGHDIRIFGHGTLSGERIPHPDDDTPPAPDEDDVLYKPINIVGARNTTVEGITIADSATHSLMLINGYAQDAPTEIRWVKIMTWRANGDGINPFRNGLIEDCFFRTADDCTYVNGRGIRRCVFWTDVNGSAFAMEPIGNTETNLIVVEDCDIIYNRSIFYQGLGGHVFNMRGTGGGEGGTNFVFRNIRVEDPRPTHPTFGIMTAGSWQSAPDYLLSRDAGDITGIRFENISIAAPSILGYPETLWGNTNAWIRDCIFSNVTMSGEPFDDVGDFNHNEYVTNLVFIAPPILEYAPDWLAEGAANVGSIDSTIAIRLTRDAFASDVVSGGHVVAANVPPGLIPVFTRIDDKQLMLAFSGNALNHMEADSIYDLTVAFTDGAFETNMASGVIGETNGTLSILFYDLIPFTFFRDSFDDDDIATATSPGDFNGGFDVYRSNETDGGLQVYETAGNGVLDLTGAVTDFSYVAMVSKHSFDSAMPDQFSLSVEVNGLTESWWYLRPFTVNLRPNSNVNAPSYQRGVAAPPLGLSLMVANQDSANCRVALVAYDGTAENWLWEDLEVTHAELADGFHATISVNRTNGWQITFSGAASLPANVSGSWDTLGWDDIFNGTTYIQCYLRENALGGRSPPVAGKAKAEIGLIEVTRIPVDMLYDAWAVNWSGADLSDPSADYDHDGLSNFGEYAFNGNPTNAADTGRMEVHVDNTWFIFVHASNVIDSSMVYHLFDRTNLVNGAVNTNSWDLQTFGPVTGDYVTVSNHYFTADTAQLFLKLSVEPESE